MMTNKLIAFFALFLCLHQLTATAQSQRSLTRNGNDLYKQGKFEDAELAYRKSLDKETEEGLDASSFNLGNALFQQEQYEGAVKRFEETIAHSKDDKVKARAYHNLGNSLLQSKKIEESIDAYKSALRLNPKDSATKYNLAYAKKLLEEQKQEQQEKQENKDCDNPQENKDNKEEQKENEEKKQDKQDENKEGEKKEQDEKDKQKEEQEKQDKQDENKEGEQEKKEEEQQKEEEKNKEGEGKDKKEEEEQKEPKEGEKGNKDEKNQGEEEKQKIPQNRALSKAEAARLLEALKNEELKVQQKLKRQQGKGARFNIEKDW